jgi:hypothetical protein
LAWADEVATLLRVHKMLVGCRLDPDLAHHQARLTDPEASGVHPERDTDLPVRSGVHLSAQ